jgi:hypothetical protein
MEQLSFNLGCNVPFHKEVFLNFLFSTSSLGLCWKKREKEVNSGIGLTISAALESFLV